MANAWLFKRPKHATGFSTRDVFNPYCRKAVQPSRHHEVQDSRSRLSSEWVSASPSTACAGPKSSSWVFEMAEKPGFVRKAGMKNDCWTPAQQKRAGSRKKRLNRPLNGNVEGRSHPDKSVPQMLSWPCRSGLEAEECEQAEPIPGGSEGTLPRRLKRRSWAGGQW